MTKVKKNSNSSKTRSQRRMEKKQALLLLVLVLVVSLASFTLGVIVGQHGAERDLAVQDQSAELGMAAKVPARPAPLVPVKPVTTADSDGVVETEVEATKLTFYDNLSKETSAPLGSGINLPPQEKKPQPISKPPIALPAKPIVKTVTSKDAALAEANKPLAKSLVGQPQVDPRGSYSVQVGSFNAAADAGQLKKQLLDKKYPAFMVEADLGDKGIWYRVRLGPYKNRATAETMRSYLESRDKIKGFISRQ